MKIVYEVSDIIAGKRLLIDKDREVLIIVGNDMNGKGPWYRLIDMKDGHFGKKYFVGEVQSMVDDLNLSAKLRF